MRRREYKSAHGMKEKKGPGAAKLFDYRNQPKREAPPLPIAGCALARLNTGNQAARRGWTSSQAVGSWWTDPVFYDCLKAPPKDPKDKGPPPASTNKTTTSEVGAYWHDPVLEDNDPHMAMLRAKNGAKRVLPVETNSQFALDDLPTADRML